MSITTHLARPDSLNDFATRLREAYEASIRDGETTGEWAASLGISEERFLRLVNGETRITARQMVAIDDLACGAFLNPPERRWALRSISRADYNQARYKR